jgi:hypothetical protein
LGDCITLATLVGAASVLPFFPAQRWFKASSTRFYVGGAEATSWPSTLTSDHNGGKDYAVSPLRMDYDSYLSCSWRILLGAITKRRPRTPGFRICIPGGSPYKYPPASLIYGKIPTPDTNYTRGDPDTLAVAPDLDIGSHMDYHNQQKVLGFQHARD